METSIKKMAYLFLSGFIPLLFMTEALQAQQSVPAGHMLDSIKLVRGTPDSTLTIEGTFSTDQFSAIKIETQQKTPITELKLPNSFINNLDLPKQMNFKGEILESVSIREKAQKQKDGNIAFEVLLELKASEPIKVILDRAQSNSKQLSFALRPLQSQLEHDADAMEGSGAPGTAKLKASSSRTLETQEMPSIPETPQSQADKTKASQMLPVVSAVDSRPERLLLHPVSAMMVFQRPTRLQVSVLNASHQMDGAQRLAILLERHQRRNLENRIGMKLEITNISSVRERMILPKTKIYYRPNYLDAALAMAGLIPGEQIIEQMTLARRGKLGIDVEVYVGENFE